MLSNARAMIFEYLIEDYYEHLRVLIENAASEKTSTSILEDKDLEMLYALGYYQFLSGRWESAKKVFFHITRRAPQSDIYWRALGLTHYQLKEFNEARIALEQALKKSPGDHVCTVYHAELQILEGRLQDGLVELTNLLELEVSFPQDIWLKRAKMLLEQNSPPK